MNDKSHKNRLLVGKQIPCDLKKAYFTGFYGPKPKQFTWRLSTHSIGVRKVTPEDIK
jgi:hypothetical protein